MNTETEALAEAQRLADKYATDWMPVYEVCSWPGCVSTMGCVGQCGKRIETEGGAAGCSGRRCRGVQNS